MNHLNDPNYLKGNVDEVSKETIALSAELFPNAIMRGFVR